MGQLAGDLKIEVAIVQIIMFRPKPAQFERTKSAANSLVFDNSLFTFALEEPNFKYVKNYQYTANWLKFLSFKSMKVAKLGALNENF